MPKITIDINVEEIKKLLPYLQPEEIITLDNDIHNYIETHIMMGAAQSAFKDWENNEEDIYNDL